MEYGMNTNIKELEINAQQKAYDFIKEEILTLRLKPFDRLSAGDLAAELGISRTPVREALGRLDQDGLVSHETAGGFYVRPMSLKEIVDVYRVREVLEVEAALEALPQMDGVILDQLAAILKEVETLLDPELYAEFVLVNRRFHAAIVDAANNVMLKRIMAPIADRVRLIGALLIQLHAPRQKEVLEENSKILEALRTGDAAQVEASVRGHVQRASEQAVHLLTRDPTRMYFNVHG